MDTSGTSSGTSAQDSKHYLLAIDVLNKSVTDTEKFAALLVVSNVLKDKPLSCEQNHCLFKSIDPKFLYRLLSSDGQSSEVPEECEEYIYQSIGVSIISSFFIRIADYIDSKTSIQLLSSMAMVLNQLNDKTEDLDQNQRQMISDIIVCFEFFFSSKHIQEMSFQSMNGLFETKFTQTLTEIHSKEKFIEFKTPLNELLVKIAVTIEWSDLDSQSFQLFITSLAQLFKANEDRLKFELCLTLSEILIKNEKYFANHSNSKSIIALITETIFHVIRSKLSKQLRDPVLRLASVLTEIFGGFQWIYGQKGWHEINSKHFLLLCRLVCIEIAVNYESENIDMTSVANCFVILEHSVITIANDCEPMKLLKHLTQEKIYDLLTAIRDTMSVIIRYLQRFSQQDIEIDIKSDVFISILASIRVLCVWVTEETEALREELADILPFIVKVFKNSISNRLSVNKPIISAFIVFTENENLKNILLNENVIQILDSVLDKKSNNDLLIRNLKLLLNN